MPDLSLMSLSLEELPARPREALHAAEEAGFQSISLSSRSELGPEVLGRSERSHLRRLLELCGLRVAAFRADPFLLLDAPSRLQRNVEHLTALFALAAELKCPLVVGRTSPTLDQNVLSELLLMAGEFEIALALECPSLEPEGLGEMLSGRRAGHLKASVDAAAQQLAERAAGDTISPLSPILAHVRFRDFVRRGEKVQQVRLGEGELRLEDWVWALREAEFTGSFAICPLQGERLAKEARIARERFLKAVQRASQRRAVFLDKHSGTSLYSDIGLEQSGGNKEEKNARDS